MKHDHKYVGCKHELAYCEHCDVVYCTKCGREWKNEYHTPYSPQIPWVKPLRGPCRDTPYWEKNIVWCSSDESNNITVTDADIQKHSDAWKVLAHCEHKGANEE